MNSLVHQWVYEDAADRAKRRAAMMADPEWQTLCEEADQVRPADGAEDLADGAGQVLPPMKK